MPPELCICKFFNLLLRTMASQLGLSILSVLESSERSYIPPHSSQINVTFEEMAINAGDQPLLSATGYNVTIMNVETTESVKGSTAFRSEVQQVILQRMGTDAPPSGTFTLGFGREETISLPVTVSATGMADALGELPSLRSAVRVSRHDGEAITWCITFIDPGAQALLESTSCATTTGAEQLSSACTLENTSLEVRRVTPGVSPASGTFRLQLTRADGGNKHDGIMNPSITGTLRVDATVEEIQAALVALPGGSNASVRISPNARSEFGQEWAISLRDLGVYAIQPVDVDIDGPGPWCTDGKVGPAVAETPCEFPFSIDHQAADATSFACAGASGSDPGWCSTSNTFADVQIWGGCLRCSDGALTQPIMHVASPRRKFMLTGSALDVSRALAEVVYHPRTYWNAWIGGVDEVSVYWSGSGSDKDFDEVISGAQARTLSQVFVAPVNDAPKVTIPQTNHIALDGQELLLDDAELGDPDLVDRPEIVMRLALETSFGTLALGDSDGLSFLVGTPMAHSSNKLVVKGSLIVLQRIMKQLYYRPPMSLAAGIGMHRVVHEVQRVELTQIHHPMIQSIATHPNGGYIGGNFTLGLKCDVFFDVLMEWFGEADSEANITDAGTFLPVVQSSPLAASVSATGNMSVETEVRTMLKSCVAYAWDLFTSLVGENHTAGNFTSSGKFTMDSHPYHAATAVVSAGEPDMLGAVTWEITLIDVPSDLPHFNVVSNNLTVERSGLNDTSYAHHGSKDPAPATVSVAITQPASSKFQPVGSFTLAVSPGGHATEPIPFSASGDEVAEALRLLPSIGAVRVSTTRMVRGSLLMPDLEVSWNITFLPSGSPVHIGDMPLLVADDRGLEAQGVRVGVSELIKGQAPSDFVRVELNDLGNVGEGEWLDATATWNITIVPESVPPVVFARRPYDGRDFLQGIEGTQIPLPTVQVLHDAAGALALESSSLDWLYLARLSCLKGSANPSPSTVGRDVMVARVSSTVTEVIGGLEDVNSALSRLVYDAPARYRGVDDVTVAVRLVDTDAMGGWGSSTINVFVDGVNDAPGLSAPRSLRAVGTFPVVAGGITLSDDDREGIMTMRLEAVRGTLSFPAPQQNKLLSISEVCRSVSDCL